MDDEKLLAIAQAFCSQLNDISISLRNISDTLGLLQNKISSLTVMHHCQHVKDRDQTKGECYYCKPNGKPVYKGPDKKTTQFPDL